ncbi:hypothetical protein J0J24_24250, partial [Vibrio vulnificus]|uniref:hypothetical protein n=1 Tax=Vibrio vulnificus TaxID=672 RepID=UPI0019D43634
LLGPLDTSHLHIGMICPLWAKPARICSWVTTQKASYQWIHMLQLSHHDVARILQTIGSDTSC